MHSDSLNDSSVPNETVTSADKTEDGPDPECPAAQSDLPVELSQFSQRLASFGLGEAPDPLLTEARPPSKRRPRR